MITYTPSAALKNYIKEKEGCAKWNSTLHVFLPYPDGGDISTIGYGHRLTHSDIQSGIFQHGLSLTTCEVLFERDLSIAVRQINSLDLELTQGQFDALVDFGWNAGLGSLSTILKYGWKNFPLHCVFYVHDAKGAIEPGLVSRRNQEVEWWHSASADTERVSA